MPLNVSKGKKKILELIFLDAQSEDVLLKYKYPRGESDRYWL